MSADSRASGVVERALLLTVLLLLALTTLLILLSFAGGVPTPGGARWEEWENASGALLNFSTVIALATGGAWAYMKYVRGRLDVPRVEQSVEGELVDNGELFLKVVVQIRNVGAIKVEWDPQESGLDYYAYSSGGRPQITRAVLWGEATTTFPVFKDHAWVEPGSSIADTLLIRLPHSPPGMIKLDMVLVTRHKDIHCVTIVERREPDRLREWDAVAAERSKR